MTRPTYDDLAALDNLTVRLALAAYARGRPEEAERIVALGVLAGDAGPANECTFGVCSSVGLIGAGRTATAHFRPNCPWLLTRLVVEHPADLRVQLTVGHFIMLGGDVGGDGAARGVPARLLAETFPLMRVYPHLDVRIDLANVGADEPRDPGAIVLTGVCLRDGGLA